MYCVCCRDLDPIQGQGQGHGAFELPTTSEAVHAGGDDRSPLAGLSGFSLALTVETLQAEICRRERFLKGVGHFDRPLKVEEDVAHQPLLGGRKPEGLPFHVV